MADEALSFSTANQGLFPQLFTLGKDLTAAAASQAYRERIFSICGDKTVGKRNRMTKGLEMRVLLKANRRHLIWILSEQNTEQTIETSQR